MRRAGRWLLWSVLALVLLTGAAGAWVYQQLCASLPLLDGERLLNGLSAPVLVERDALGVPTLHAANRVDAALVMGFLHAQDRFFQMDLLRRSAAGELAELFGAVALDHDRRVRPHRFRSRAGRVLDLLPADQRQLLDAYVAGVNQGLAGLAARPFEYLLLRRNLAPWQAADTLLSGYAIYLDLHDETGALDSVRGLLRDRLPAPVAEFLDPAGSDWDAPLLGEPLAPVPVPPAELFNLRALPLPDTEAPALIETRPEDGSNAWALAGRFTSHGGALLANDMHLGLRVPNIWYRLVLRYPDGTGGERRVVGVTLPGTPLVVVGSNGSLAWGFTNSYGDWTDLVELELPGEDDSLYWTFAGPQAFQRQVEILRVAGGPDETLDVSETLWGPVIDRDHRGRPRALRWTAHEPRAIDLSLIELERGDTVAAGLELAARAGLPSLNIVLADTTGRIGWTIAGPIPERGAMPGHDECSGRYPHSWRMACWRGWLAADRYPRLIDPEEGRIWSANQRKLDGEALSRLGFSAYPTAARARQIRDRLRALEHADEATMLAVQLDDRALFFQRWRELLLGLLDEAALALAPERDELRRLVADWDGRASVDAVGYRLVHEFREAVAARVFEPLNRWLSQFDPRFNYGLIRQREAPLWTLVEQRPPHWLNSEYPDWRTLLLAAVDQVIADLTADGRKLSDRRWGERNTLRMRHPLSPALPLPGRWLDMPAQPLPGGIFMPRVQGTAQGASQRLVVAPGREEQGIFHMPGGQSGHPLSPYYRAGHAAWVRGEPSPLLPGPTQHRLRLLPDTEE